MRRRVLTAELGLEPSEELRMVQQAILRQDPSLEVSAVDAVEPRADRRTVTVLFCDLVDSTKLATDLDPEVYRGVMSRYFEAVRKPIERHGGTVEKFIGDAVLAVFGVPELHEDDALRAVRAAAEIQSSLRDGDVPLEARVGVSTRRGPCPVRAGHRPPCFGRSGERGLTASGARTRWGSSSR